MRPIWIGLAVGIPLAIGGARVLQQALNLSQAYSPTTIPKLRCARVLFARSLGHCHARSGPRAAL